MKALGFFEAFNRLEKELYEAYSQNVGFKNGLAISFIRLGLVFEQKVDKEKAKEYYRLSEEHLLHLAGRFPAYAEFQKNLQWVQNRLATMDEE